MKAMGYDRTVTLSEDEFGRDFLVRSVYDILMTPPPAWSVRVALNGDWGSGKTSIAESIDELARADGHAVGWIYPWRVSSSKDVAIALTATVLSALAEAEFSLPSKTNARETIVKRLGLLKKLKGLHKVADVALSILEDANTFDAEFAAPIVEELEKAGKRLLIIIDDLDRCEPAFLPSLLLFMRTALDIPGISFLAPFDSDIVAKTLVASNKAWTSADRFLEKVFDFRIPIPDLTEEQKRLFLASQLARSAIPVSDKALNVASALLPGTPRAIKALVRDLSTMRGEFSRRKPEELNWSVLLLAMMLRATSLEFFRAYRRQVDSSIDQLQAGNNRKCKIDLTSVWQLVGEPDPATVHRANELVQVLEDTALTGSINELHHALHFTDEHEPVTEMEFENSMAAWLLAGLTTALAHPPLSPMVLLKDAPMHLVSRAISGYQRSLGDISATFGHKSLEERMLARIDRARNQLTFALELLSLEPHSHREKRFDLFVRLLLTERDLRKDGVDALQPEALRILQRLCAESGDDWERYDAVIKTLSFYPNAPAWNIATAAALRALMIDRAREELRRRIRVVDGFAGIFDSDSNNSLLAQVFLDPADLFWTNADYAPEVLEEALVVVGENLGTMFDSTLSKVTSGLSMDGISIFRLEMQRHASHHATGQVRSFLQSKGTIGLVWKAYEKSGHDAAKLAMRHRQLIGLGVQLPGRTDQTA
jgi:hypothetical protein